MFLIEDPGRPDTVIAGLARCGTATVSRARAWLEDTGVIAPRPRQRTPGRPAAASLMLAARMPDLSAGSCRSHAQPDLWTSGDRVGRNAAARICRTCPVLEACREWAVTSLPRSDEGVWGGLLPGQRVKARTERLRAAPALVGMPLINSRKTECRNGHKLEGANVKTITRSDGRGEYRECVPCRRAQLRAYARARRERQAARLAGMSGMPARNAAKTHCLRGHELAGENLVMVKGKGGRLYRRCRTCFRVRTARYERLRRKLGKAPDLRRGRGRKAAAA